MSTAADWQARATYARSEADAFSLRSHFYARRPDPEGDTAHGDYRRELARLENAKADAAAAYAAHCQAIADDIRAHEQAGAA